MNGSSRSGSWPARKRRDGASQELVVEREADGLDLAALTLAEQLAGAANLEVVRRQREARAELLERLDGLQALQGVGRQRVARRREQVRVRLMVRAADAAAQLVQLRQAQAIGAIDDDGVGRRDIDAALDDRRADQHVELAMVEIEHHLLELALRHLPMADAHFGLRQQLAQVFGHGLDVLDAIVDEIDLAAAADLAQHGFANLPVAPFADERFHGQPLGRRRRDDRQIAQPAERHVQRARNRRGRQRQHVDFGAQPFQPFLVLDAEAMLLVDDDQPQAFELDVALQQLVRADHDVDGARRQALDSGRRAARAAEPRQELDTHRPVGEPIIERAMVLLGEQRRRHEHRDLEPRLHRDERRAQRDFGLAEADVAADDAVHGPRALEVCEHAVDRRLLVLGFLERELQYEPLVARFVELELGARPRRALCVEVQAARRPCRALAGRLCAWPCPIDPCRADAAARPREMRRYSA